MSSKNNYISYQQYKSYFINLQAHLLEKFSILKNIIILLNFPLKIHKSFVFETPDLDKWMYIKNIIDITAFIGL